MSESQTPNSARPGRRRWPRRLRDLGLLLAAFAAIQWWQARDLADGAAPALVGLLNDGRPYQLDPARGPVLVHFWASWCPICRLEQDSIAAIARDRPVITVATTSGDAGEVSDYLAGHDLVDLAVLMDEDGAIARGWGVQGVPATFIVDRDNRIRYAGMGYATEAGLRLRLWWAD